MTPLRIALAAAAIALACTHSADAKVTGTPAGFVVRYPSGDAPDPATLQAIMSNPAVSTIVFEKGTQLFSSTLFVFKRNDLTLCGATGDPKDVTLASSARTAIQIEQARGTVIRGLTISTAATGGVGVLVNAVPGPTLEGFADDTSIERCSFKSYVGVQASVRARNLSVADSRFETGPFSPGSTDGGAGIFWEDGPGLFVTRCRFSVADGVSALAALFVKGAQSPSSAGDRARQILITRNTVDGDFATGMDLADVTDAIVRQNKIKFPSTSVPGVRGRVGIVVRRAGATQVTDDYEVSRNVVTKSHYGLWLLGVSTGVVAANDFGGCGSATVDNASAPGFEDTGGAVRVNLLSSTCSTTFAKNDFRGLRSPPAVPAVVLLPSTGTCDEALNPGNRTDRGRPLFGGQQLP